MDKGKEAEEKTLYVDASGQILGRLASIVAKKLLSGHRIYIVNAEKAVVSGARLRVLKGYALLLKVRTHYNPEKQGIRRPRTPEGILRRAVRGMLPMDKPKGREAFKKLRVFRGVPKELEGKTFIKFEEADSSRLKGEYVTVEEIARHLGWKG